MKLLRKKWARIAAGILLGLLLLFGAFHIYAADYYRAAPIATEALTQNTSISIVQTDNLVIFSPNNTFRKVGFIFYPGGKVEHLAYTPLMQQLAGHGITCVLLKVPYNLAVFDINGADRAMKAVPNITNWYVGGHSLGGSMASVYAASHADKVNGIIFLASYPASDLSKTKLKMLSVYGSKDKVLNRTNFEQAKVKAPKDAKYVEIDGGNHAYFGAYGEQKGDGTATISDTLQQCNTAIYIEERIGNFYPYD